MNIRSKNWPVILLGVLSLLSGGPDASPAAVADDLSSGLWYFERGHVQEAHDAGFTGEGVTIAVLDTQINPDVPTLRGANLEVVEKSYCFDEAGQPVPPVSTDYVAASHGTAVAAMIAGTGASASGGPGTKGVAPGAKVLYSAVGVYGGDSAKAICFDEKGEDWGPFGSGDALRDAIDAGVDIISISYRGFNGGDTSEQLIRALALGIVVVGGLPNDVGIVGWPAGANGVVAVQAFDANGQIQTHAPVGGTEPLPNTSDFVEVAAPGVGVLVPGTPASWDANDIASGTSFATPIVAGFLAVVKSKYPEVTGNQLIQSMIHNTGTAGEHEPRWGNEMGYGAISLASMLPVNPAKYPDDNPLLIAGATEIPTVDEVAKAREELAKQESASPTPTADSEGASEPGVPTWLPWTIGGGVVGLLVIAGVAILVVVASRSSAQSQRGRGGDAHGG